MITVHSSSESSSKQNIRLNKFLGVGEIGALLKDPTALNKVHVLQHLLSFESASFHHCLRRSFPD